MIESGLCGISPATLPDGMETESPGNLTFTILGVSRGSLDGERFTSMPSSAIILVSVRSRRNLSHATIAKVITSTEGISIIRENDISSMWSLTGRKYDGKADY
jgi:hypothetical protein